MADWTQKEIDEVYVAVQRKAATDAAFRKELLDNPNAAIEKLSGKALPAGCKFKVIEQDPNYTATFVIPDLVADELSPEALDKVAGGTSFFLIVSATPVAIGVSDCPADACGLQIHL